MDNVAISCDFYHISINTNFFINKISQKNESYHQIFNQIINYQQKYSSVPTKTYAFISHLPFPAFSFTFYSKNTPILIINISIIFNIQSINLYKKINTTFINFKHHKHPFWHLIILIYYLCKRHKDQLPHK